MTRALTELRRWWSVIAAVLAGVGLYIVYRMRQPDANQVRSPLNAARQKARDRVAVAHARAAVEIAVARTEDQQQRAQLAAVLADPDEERRQAALVEMAARIRRTR